MNREHKVKRENEQDATNSKLLSNFLSQHVSGIIMPIIGRIRYCPTACGVLPGCVGCGWLWSCGTASLTVSTMWESNSNLHTVRTAHDAVQDHSQPQLTHPGRTPHAVGHGLILLMMGIMMPETCWDRKVDNKHRISCILLVFSLFTLWKFAFFPGALNTRVGTLIVATLL